MVNARTNGESASWFNAQRLCVRAWLNHGLGSKFGIGNGLPIEMSLKKPCELSTT